MSEWVTIFILTMAAGLAIVVGALIASVEHISNRWLENELRHSVIAFGGGILISAVALVLVHEGMKNLTPFFVALFFGLGGVCFMSVDMFLGKIHAKASQLIAMLLDFIPEVIALGALYLLDKNYAILLAFLIIFQNLPEGFNAYLELRAGAKHKGRTLIYTFSAMSFLGPILGLSGYFFLSKYQFAISGIMLFASGGILYLIFQDIAPMAKVKHRWAPALGAVLGFIFGMIGKMLMA
jgi:zinc transporter, ZIP family